MVYLLALMLVPNLTPALVCNLRREFPRWEVWFVSIRDHPQDRCPTSALRRRGNSAPWGREPATRQAGRDRPPSAGLGCQALQIMGKRQTGVPGARKRARPAFAEPRRLNKRTAAYGTAWISSSPAIWKPVTRLRFTPEITEKFVCRALSLETGWQRKLVTSAPTWPLP